MSAAIDASVELMEAISHLRLPVRADRRLQDLLDTNNNGALTDDERDELAELVEWSESISLLRARALRLFGEQTTEQIVHVGACRTGASIKSVAVAEVATGADEFQSFLQHIEVPKAKSSPPWFQDRRVLIGGGAAAVLVMLAVIFLLPPHGTLRVEILDPSVEMRLKGTPLTFQGDDLKAVSLQTGEKKLLVTRGDLCFETESFVFRKGKETRIKVELTDDKIVVKSDGKVIAELKHTPRHAVWHE